MCWPRSPGWRTSVDILHWPGAPAAVYIKVQDRLSQFVRTLFYNRAGYDHSTMADGTSSIIAQDSAEELGELVRALDLKPPYLLVGHSYGGILAREFLHYAAVHHKNLSPSSSRAVVCGMVLVDVPTELAFSTFPRLPSADLVAVSKDVDWAAVTGLKSASGMTDEEWGNAMAGTERSAQGLSKEDTHRSAYTLAQRRQMEANVLDGGVLAVVRFNSARDYQLLYDEGVKLGAGTEEERSNAREFIEQWSLFNHELVRAQLDLIGDQNQDDKRYTYSQEWGHDGPLRNSDLVADPVRWALRRLQEQRCTT